MQIPAERRGFQKPSILESFPVYLGALMLVHSYSRSFHDGVSLNHPGVVGVCVDRDGVSPNQKKERLRRKKTESSSEKSDAGHPGIPEN
jgi:hypothetical protein